MNGRISLGNGTLATLINLFPESGAAQKSGDYNEGVRIGFALTSRGEVIDHEIIGWLKKTIKSYINEAISHFFTANGAKSRPMISQHFIWISRRKRKAVILCITWNA